MSRKEKIILVVIAFLGVLLLANLMVFNWQRASADSVIFVDLLKNIAKTGKPESHLAVMTQDFLFNRDKYLTIPAENLKELSYPLPHYESNNFFKFHFYAILYLLAPLGWCFSSVMALCGIISLSFVFLVAIIYWILRSKRVGLLGSLFFCWLIVNHPAWSDAIQGQIYPDRIFLALGIVLMWLLTEDRRFKWLVVMGAMSALVVEKIAILVGLVIVGYAFLNRKRVSYWILGLSILLFGWSIVKFYLKNDYYSSFISLGSVINFPNVIINNQIIRSNLISFFVVNLPLLILSLFSPKWGLLALGTMLPNIFGDIGGAEKVGWTTHYHSIYFPVLAWSALNGYLLVVKKKYWLVLAVIGLSMVGSFSWEKIKKSPLVVGKNLAFYVWNKRGKYLYPEDKLATAIPEGSTVSVPELFFKSLYRRNKVYYFPMGMDETDYVVLQIKNGKYGGFISYLGEENAAQADEILLARMKEKGYETSSPLIVGNAAVFKRNQGLKIK